MELTYSRASLQDLRDIVDYIGLDKPQAALAVVDEIERVCELIASMPGVGKPVDVPTSTEILMHPCGKYPYRIFYTRSETHITIQRVSHGRQDLESFWV